MPIQFWPVDCDTYNEVSHKGIHYSCFCAPWNCSDSIPLQFVDTDNLNLIIYNEDGEAIHTTEFDQAGDVSSLTITPSDISPEICDQKIKMYVYELGSESVADSEFSSGTGWDLGLWTLTGGLVRRNLTNAAGTTDTGVIMTEFFDTLKGHRLMISADVAVSAGTSPQVTGSFFYSTYRNGVLINTEAESYTISGSSGGPSSTRTFEVEVISTDIIDQIEIYFTLTGNTNGATIQYRVFSVSVNGFADAAKSDGLEIKEAHIDPTILITYSNNRNYAGLVYESSSPANEFHLRVPARFFHERFPEEDEALELTSSVITTSSQVKTQKLLEVLHVPYYFHKKLKLVLKHQTIEINDYEWTKEESYDIIEGSKKWPKKSATCWLTEKSSVTRNVL